MVYIRCINRNQIWWASRQYPEEQYPDSSVPWFSPWTTGLYLMSKLSRHTCMARNVICEFNLWTLLTFADRTRQKMRGTINWDLCTHYVMWCSEAGMTSDTVLFVHDSVSQSEEWAQAEGQGSQMCAPTLMLVNNYGHNFDNVIALQILTVAMHCIANLKL